MRAVLIFLSLFVGYLCSHAGDVAGSEVRRYSFALETRDGSVTGILLLTSDGDLVKGAIVNEFGFTAVSFVYNAGKQSVKLVDVIGFLDKWRVRYVLRRDLAALMKLLDDAGAKVGRQYDVENDGDLLRLVNRSRNLSYSIIDNL